MMDGKYQAARQMGRWSLAGLILVGAFCIALASEKAPEKKRPAGATPAAPAQAAAKAPEMGARAPGAAALDPRIQKLGEETRQRITTFTDETTLTLAAGGAGDLKLKPNAARVAALRVKMLPPSEGLNFEVAALDGTGAVISNPPSKIGPIALDDGMQFGVFVPSAPNQLVKLRITPRKAGAGQYQVGVKALITRQPTPEEIKTMLLAGGRQGRMMLDLVDLGKRLERYKQENGKYPDTLAALEIAIPRDPYSPKGEPYHYELVKEGYMISSCGEDGIWGNDDDTVSLRLGRDYSVTGDRKTLIIPKDTPGEVTAQNEYTGPSGRRPKGNCLLTGRVISEKTGQPVDHATVHLFYADTLDSLFIHVASDGSFEFKDVPPGNYSLKVTNTTGYQPVYFDPEGKKGDLPLFTLKEKEARRGIEFKLKPSYRITGRVLDEDGKAPADARELTAIAWSGQPDQENATFRFIIQAPVNPKDGAFTLDGLSGEPVYLAVQDLSAHEKEHSRPVTFYPGTLLRGEAKPVAFTDAPVVKGVEIRLTRKGGQVVEGVVTAAGTGKPVAGAMVVVHHADMLFDRNVTYTDAQGHYRFDCLGSGRYQIHVDATPQNLVRTRKLLALDPGKSATVDFTLKLGATLAGRITDEKGNDLPTVNQNTFGSARLKQAPGERSCFSGVPHKNAPKTVGSGGTCIFAGGEGDYEEEGLRYPTASTFIVQGLAPGEALLNFEHYTKGKKVLMIMHGAQDVLKGGLTARPGEKIDDLVIVVGPDDPQGARK